MAELDSVTDDIRLRQALYGGLLGSAGVILAWMVWVVIQAWHQDWVSVVRAPAVGATLGIVVDFLAGHVRDSAHEARGGPASPEPTSREGQAPGGMRRFLGPIAAFSLVFLAGACENLVGDRIASLWRPFLVSVATFFPVGAVFAWRLHARAFHSHSLPSNLFHGLLAGRGRSTTPAWMFVALR